MKKAKERWQATPDDYLKAAMILRHIKVSRLTPQQKRTLRGQALHGDIEGAWKGFERLSMEGG